MYCLLVPRTEHHFSSFKCCVLNIFSRQNLLRCLSRLLFLLRWKKYGAKKCLKNHIPFNFWDDSTLANQVARKNRKAFEGASMEPTIVQALVTALKMPAVPLADQVWASIFSQQKFTSLKTVNSPHDNISFKSMILRPLLTSEPPQKAFFIRRSFQCLIK